MTDKPPIPPVEIRLTGTSLASDKAVISERDGCVAAYVGNGSTRSFAQAWMTPDEARQFAAALIAAADMASRQSDDPAPEKP